MLNNGGGFRNKPKALMCYICGREFGTASLQIHLKACAKKWEAQENLKPKNERRPLPQPPKELNQMLGGGKNGELDWNDLEAYNKQANEKWNDEALIRCEFCNRTFLPERMPIHRKVCTEDKPFKPLPKGGGKEPTTTSTPSITSKASVKTTSGYSNPYPDDEDEEDYYQPKKTVGVTKKMGTTSGGGGVFGTTSGGTMSKPGGSTMKPGVGGSITTKSTKTGGFDQKIGGGGKSSIRDTGMGFGGVKLDLVPCSLCGRNFASDRVERHEKACAKLAKADAKHQKRVAKAEAKKRELELFKKKEEKIKKQTSRWRAQHEELQQALKYMRKVKKVQQMGGDIRMIEPPPQSNTDHLVPCPYCNRKYAPKTAERHIPKCKDIINKPKPPPTKNRYAKDAGSGSMGYGNSSYGNTSYGNNFSGGGGSYGNSSTSTSISSRNSIQDYGYNQKSSITQSGGIKPSPMTRAKSKDPYSVKKDTYSPFEAEPVYKSPVISTHKAYGGGFSTNQTMNKTGGFNTNSTMNKTGGLDFKNVGKTTMDNGRMGGNNQIYQSPSLKQNVGSTYQGQGMNGVKSSYSGMGNPVTSSVNQSGAFKAYSMKKSSAFNY